MVQLSSRRQPSERVEPTDEELVAAAGAGDAAALGSLYDRHGDAIYQFVCRMGCVDNQDAEDLVQDVFVAVAKSAHRYAAHAAVRTWLLAIAANLARASARKSLRFRVFRAVLERLPARPSPRTPEADLTRAEQLRALKSAVARLPHDQRVAFLMCDVDEVPAAELAATLDVPRGTIYRRLHDARRALRALLEEHRS